MEEYQEIILAIIALVMTLVAAYASTQWVKVKKILTKFRELMDTTDDALKDDKVTKEELHDILEKLRNLYYAIIGKKKS